MQHSHRIKDRYRSVFVGMLVLRAEGKPVAKCCHCGETFFALNPYGKILACLGSEKPRVMGNLKRDSFKSIWNSPKGRAEREACNLCNRNCCMSGNRAIDIKRDFARSTFKAFFAPSANSNAQGGTATF